MHMEGRVFSYIHANGQVGAMVKVSTITDFAARTDEFIEFGKDVAMQIAAMDPTNTKELLDQAFIKDGEQTVGQLLNGIAKKLGEKVVIEAFDRYSMK